MMSKVVLPLAILLGATAFLAVTLLRSDDGHGEPTGVSRPDDGMRPSAGPHGESTSLAEQASIERAPIPSGHDGRDGVEDLQPDQNASSPEAVDASGLTTLRKIEVVLQSYERYREKHDAESAIDMAMAEYNFTIRCATTVLREAGEAQYALDVDSREQRGFKLAKPTESLIEVASDNAKYSISVLRFPAVGIARERLEAAYAGAPPSTISGAEEAAYEHCYTEALAALGVRPSESD